MTLSISTILCHHHSEMTNMFFFVPWIICQLGFICLAKYDMQSMAGLERCASVTIQPKTNN